MTGKHMKRASLADIRRMNEAGQLVHDRLAAERTSGRRRRAGPSQLDAEVRFFRDEAAERMFDKVPSSAR